MKRLYDLAIEARRHDSTGRAVKAAHDTLVDECLRLGPAVTLTIPAMLCHKKAKGADGKTRKVPGPPTAPKLVGYYTKGGTPNWARASEYNDWKDHVREQATAQGLKVPTATKAQPVRLDVTCYFPSGTHGDPENVRKGIVDALFRHREGGDKYVYGYHHFPLYDAESPRVVVEIVRTDMAGQP